jgi:hypothetical protein
LKSLEAEEFEVLFGFCGVFAATAARLNLYSGHIELVLSTGIANVYCVSSRERGDEEEKRKIANISSNIYLIKVNF